MHLKVSGLKAGESVEVGTQGIDVSGKQWHGQATFTADDQGAIDLNHATPSNGTNQTVDGMGLFTTGLPAAVVGCALGRWRGNPQLERVTPLVLRAGCGWAGGGEHRWRVVRRLAACMAPAAEQPVIGRVGPPWCRWPCGCGDLGHLVGIAGACCSLVGWRGMRSARGSGVGG
ncbi:acyl-CoA thioesterase/BAAT N-terminal domain-containing protein, partial [Kribbella qitaiheensis]|uniref:acyl-CoA thioesterase/BAAT N-terminal domain-containing protein n=1 Tax=Kribbella qitaiheensis TaxID=1544730 RepID=UPI00360BAB97